MWDNVETTLCRRLMKAYLMCTGFYEVALLVLMGMLTIITTNIFNLYPDISTIQTKWKGTVNAVRTL
jgi:hypothetical protein